MKTSTIATTAVLLCSSATPAEVKLTIVAQSRSMIWNAVAVTRDQVYVAGPRWTGSKGPAVARLKRGMPVGAIRSVDSAQPMQTPALARGSHASCPHGTPTVPGQSELSVSTVSIVSHDLNTRRSGASWIACL